VARDETYTHGHHESVLRSHSWRTVENSAAYLLSSLRPGLDVLDIGCGPGTITADLAGRVDPGTVVGVDRSREVLDEARRAAGPATNLRFEAGDVYDLGYPDDSFDVVHAHQLLQHLSDPVAALREMRRVCRPGGVVAARDADYASFAWAPADARLDEWLALYRSVARANGGDPDAGRHLLGWAHASGCEHVEASASVWCFATPEDRAWWADSLADRMRHSSVADQALALGLATRDDLDAMGDAFHAWRSHPDAWFAVLHGEILAREERPR
jgi:SAM-dependent methyltransferase